MSLVHCCVKLCMYCRVILCLTCTTHMVAMESRMSGFQGLRARMNITMLGHHSHDKPMPPNPATGTEMQAIPQILLTMGHVREFLILQQTLYGAHRKLF